MRQCTTRPGHLQQMPFQRLLPGAAQARRGCCQLSRRRPSTAGPLLLAAARLLQTVRLPPAGPAALHPGLRWLGFAHVGRCAPQQRLRWLGRRYRVSGRQLPSPWGSERSPNPEGSLRAACYGRGRGAAGIAATAALVSLLGVTAETLDSIARASIAAELQQLTRHLKQQW